MLVYLDMCCLKRPFDDQSQARVRLESEAVLGLLAGEGGGLQFVRSPALVLENSRNPIKERAARVELWLRGAPLCKHDEQALVTRTSELMGLGLGNFDALHLASAEQAGADVLASCDDRFLARAVRGGDKIRVRVVGVVELADEVLR